MPEDVFEALVSMAHAGQANGFTKSEFAADGDLALFFRFFGQQTGRHIAGVNQNERRVEQCRDQVHFLALRPVRNRMKGCTQGEAAFIAAGMHVNYDAHLRENARLYEICNAVRDRAARITRKRAIHVHAIER